MCADMYVYAAAFFSKWRSSTECPEELHIIDVDTTILKLVEQSVKRWKQDPESINQRNTLPKYLKENPQEAGYAGYLGGVQESYGGHIAVKRRRGGYEKQQFGRGYGNGIYGIERRHSSTSPHNKNMEAKLEIASSITKLPDEHFHWGGIAKRFIIDKQVTVKIYKGDLTKVMQMDAIVCGTGTDLQPKGFISEALQKAGGYEYTTNYNKMKDKHKICNPSDVFKCKAGDLGARFVLHVASRELIDATPKEMVAYRECMESVLKKAKRNEMKKLAIPLFGTGNATLWDRLTGLLGQIQPNRRKQKLCGAACLKALDDFLVRYGDKHDVQEIHLINNSYEVTDALEEVFKDAMDNSITGVSGSYNHIDSMQLEDDDRSDHNLRYTPSFQVDLTGQKERKKKGNLMIIDL